MTRRRFSLFPGGGRKFLRETVGFGLAGGLAMVVDLAVFNALLLVEINTSIANVSAAIAALLVNFVINHRTFIPNGSMRKDLTKKSVKFGTIAIISFLYLLVGFEIALWLFPEQSATFYSVIRILLIGSGTLVRFFVLKFWVFTHKNETPAT